MDGNSRSTDLFPDGSDHFQDINYRNIETESNNNYLNNLRLLNLNSNFLQNQDPSKYSTEVPHQIQNQTWQNYNNPHQQNRTTNKIFNNQLLNREQNNSSRISIQGRQNGFGSPDLKMIISEKEHHITNLKEELNNYKNVIRRSIENKPKNKKLLDQKKKHYSQQPIPINIDELFRTLSTKLNEKEKELIEIKGTFKNILTALALDPKNNATNYSEFDLEAISHSMVSQIEQLVQENQEMSRLLSFERAKITETEIQLIKEENKKLNEELSKLKATLKT